MYSQNVTAQILLKVVLRAGKVTEKDNVLFCFSNTSYFGTAK